jgi:hypothetical protein
MNEFTETSTTQTLIIDCLFQDSIEERSIKVQIDEKMTVKGFKLKVNLLNSQNELLFYVWNA